MHSPYSFFPVYKLLGMLLGSQLHVITETKV